MQTPDQGDETCWLAAVAARGSLPPWTPFPGHAAQEDDALDLTPPGMQVSPVSALTGFLEQFALPVDDMDQHQLSDTWDWADLMLHAGISIPPALRILLEFYRKDVTRAFGGENARIEFKTSLWTDDRHPSPPPPGTRTQPVPAAGRQ